MKKLGLVVLGLLLLLLTAGGGIALNAELSGEKKEAAFKFLEFFYGDELYQGLAKSNIVVQYK